MLKKNLNWLKRTIGMKLKIEYFWFLTIFSNGLGGITFPSNLIILDSVLMAGP